MSIEAHVAELERRHRALEMEIAEAHAHPSIDDPLIDFLERHKLLVKEELARPNTKQSTGERNVRGSRRWMCVVAMIHGLHQRADREHRGAVGGLHSRGRCSEGYARRSLHGRLDRAPAFD